jgi:hypothetical protein
LKQFHADLVALDFTGSYGRVAAFARQWRHPKSHRFKVYTAGQKRGMTDQIKREMRRRSAVEPVIGHLKDDHRLGRNHLAHAQCDAIDAVLAAIG